MRPASSGSEFQVLVVAVMSERRPPDRRSRPGAGRPVRRACADARRYRVAEEISASAAAGTASTEDLRQAMIHYRALFRELLGDSAEGTSPPADPDTAQDLPAA